MAMATLFKFEYRQGLLGHDKPGPSNDKPKGLLGGPEKARSVLVDATKQDDLRQKTLDFLSRNKLDHWEFMLEKFVFNMVLETFHVRPMLDAFASKGTAQIPCCYY